jgi:uncharacterized protein
VQRRLAYLPLHTGKAPAWLFVRMAQLAGSITMAVVEEYGSEEMLRRLADPWWFQAFGCTLGFDWHSSGVTTVTCGALKEAQRHLGRDLGIFVAGGKGATSRKTPDEIANFSDRFTISEGDKLIHASRMSAKVDSAALQDGYDLYHHSFFFTENGRWCVVQQGMNEAYGKARRYHWLGESVNDFVCEPHHAVEDLSQTERSEPSQLCIPLNMVAAEAEANRHASAELIRQKPDTLLQMLESASSGPTLFAPGHHPVLPTDVNVDRLRKIVRIAHERHPADFAALLGTPQVGAATVRSLALIAELIYNAPVSHRDPVQIPARAPAAGATKNWADYSYAHGGKDGHPFPVDRATYDQNIVVLTQAVRKAKLGFTEKKEALKRLAEISDSQT